MNARVLEPQALVSLVGIDELHGICALADGGMRIGAFTRHADTAASDLLRGAAGVMRHAAAQIANATVRNMGTIGGSIAFADPGLDYPPALVAAGRVDRDRRRLRPPSGRGADFFVDWYATALEPGELVTAVAPRRRRAPAAPASTSSTRASPATTRRRRSAACLEAPGRVRVAIGACGPTPLCRRRRSTRCCPTTAATPRRPAPPPCSRQPRRPARRRARQRRLPAPADSAPAARAVRTGRSGHRAAGGDDDAARPVSTRVEPATSTVTTADVRAGLHDTLLTVLRDQLQLTAAKRGCNQGVCGACTVEHRRRADARVPEPGARPATDRPVRTLEGLVERSAMQALQRAFAQPAPSSAASARPACWSPRMRCSHAEPAPDEAAMRSALSGNLCRCTGYATIIDAVQGGGPRSRRDGAAVDERALPAAAVGVVGAAARRRREAHRHAPSTSPTSTAPACCTARSCRARTRMPASAATT